LDNGFKPLKAITRKRALKLEFLQKAFFLTPHLMQLTKHISKHFFCKQYTKWYVYARDHNTCQYCGKELIRTERTIDHVIPVKYGGVSSYENCVTACRSCNILKGHKKAEEVGLKLKSTPRIPLILEVLRQQHRNLFEIFDAYVFGN
jgi:hypothetical protein